MEIHKCWLFKIFDIEFFSYQTLKAKSYRASLQDQGIWLRKLIQIWHKPIYVNEANN